MASLATVPVSTTKATNAKLVGLSGTIANGRLVASMFGLRAQPLIRAPRRTHAKTTASASTSNTTIVASALVTVVNFARMVSTCTHKTCENHHDA